MAGAPGAAPALPFPGCNPAAVPEGSGPGHTKAFLCFKHWGLFFQGGKEELAWPPGNSQGSPGRSVCPRLTGKKEGLLKKKTTSDPEQGSQGCGCESTELLLFPAFWEQGWSPPLWARCVPRDFGSRWNGGTWHTRGFVPSLSFHGQFQSYGRKAMGIPGALLVPVQGAQLDHSRSSWFSFSFTARKSHSLGPCNDSSPTLPSSHREAAMAPLICRSSLPVSIPNLSSPIFQLIQSLQRRQNFPRSPTRNEIHSGEDPGTLHSSSIPAPLENGGAAPYLQR